MPAQPFEPYLELARQHLQALAACVGTGAAPHLEALTAVLADLQQAGEAVRQQQQELDETRQALGLERQRYQALFEFARRGHLVTDSQGLIREANPAAAELLGAPQAGLIGRSLWPFMAEANRPDLQAQLQLLTPASSATPVTVDFTLQPQGGLPIPVSAAVGLAHAAQGQPEELRWSLYDRSADKKSEERQRYQAALLENVSDAIVASDEAFRLTIWNAAAEALYGWKAEEVLGRSGLEILQTEYPGVDKQAMLAYIAQTGVWRGEVTQVRKDGTIIPVEVASLVLRNAAGQITSYASVNRDITGRKQVEVALRASEAQYRQLVDNLQEGIWRIDAEGRTTFVNPRMAEMLGYTPAEMEGKPLFDFMAAASVALARRSLERRQQGIREQHDFEFRRRDGRRLYASLETSPLLDEGGRYVGAIAAVADITARRLAEEALEQLNAALDERVRQRTAQLECEIAERQQAEAALQKSEERYRSLVTATSQIVWITNAQGEVVDDLPTWRAFTGQSETEILGQGWVMALHPDDRAATLAIWAQAVKTRSLYDTEYRVRGRDGTYCHFSVRGVPVLEKDGTIREWVGTCADISDRKHAEQTLRLANAYHRTLIEASLDPLVTITPAGTIDDVNAATEHVTGYSREALIGTECYAYFTDPVSARASFRRIFEEGQVRDIELEIRHRDGPATPVLFSATVYRDDAGQVRGVFAAARDISARKAAEDLLRRNAAHSQALAEVSQTLAEATHDYQFVLETIAQRTAQLFGDVCLIRLLSDDGQWLEPAVFHHPDPAVMARLRPSVTAIPTQGGGSEASRVALTGQALLLPTLTQAQSQMFSHQSGEAVDFRLYSLLVVCLRAQGRNLGTLSLGRLLPGSPFTQADLATTQSLAARAALAIVNARLYQDLEKALAKEQTTRAQLVQNEKLAAMGRLVASVAHEIHNPLQIIQNCIFLIENAITPDSPIHHYLAMANSEIRRLSHLVAQLREVYRPRATGPMQRLDPCEVLEEVANLVASQLDQLHVTWHYTPDLQCPPVNGLADQLKQVFINLSLNAAEAMQPKGGALWVETHHNPFAGRVGFSFRDAGPGIAAEHLPQLFEPFFTTKSAGLGLGLSICNDIVQHHGGTIVVESQPGQGAVFTVWLPAAV